MPQSLAELGEMMPAPSAPPNGLQLSLLGQMLGVHRERMAPRFQWRIIDPGPTWGGRDRNAMQPDDVMQSRFYPAAPENL